MLGLLFISDCFSIFFFFFKSFYNKLTADFLIIDEQTVGISNQKFADQNLHIIFG